MKKISNHMARARKKRVTQSEGNAATNQDQDETPSKEERIWSVVAMIPPGKVASYGQVAALAGLPGRARYVGTLMSRLPAKTTLPWHRVVNSSLRIAERGATSVQRQRHKLQAEGVLFMGKRISEEHRWETE